MEYFPSMCLLNDVCVSCRPDPYFDTLEFPVALLRMGARSPVGAEDLRCETCLHTDWFARPGSSGRSPVFPARPGEYIEWYGKEGTVDSHTLTLGQGLSYRYATCIASDDDAILGICVEGHPFKLCFNLSDQTATSFVQGLEVSPWFTGSVHLHPLTTAAALIPRGARATFSFLLITQDFMREIASGAGLPEEPRPLSKPSTHEPWMLSARAPAEAIHALARIEGCPLLGPLRRLYIEAKALEVIALLLARMPVGGGNPTEVPLPPA